ncbi:MAG: hypothetical protein WD404_10615 [Solirubrobacterales bacterium]
MTEAKALILTSIGLMVPTIAIGFVLGALEANGIAWGFLLVGSAALGGYVLSLVVMHYARPRHRPR